MRHAEMHEEFAGGPTELREVVDRQRFNVAVGEDRRAQCRSLPAPDLEIAIRGFRPQTDDVIAARRFDRPTPRLVSPRVYRAILHPLMLRRGDQQARRRLERSEVYFPYFSLDLRFDDRGARALLDPLAIRATPIVEYFDALIDFAEAAGWGRAPIGRARAHARRRSPAGAS